jgi:hypothetical protein
MKLPKYEGPDLQEAKAQFTALHKEAEALVATSQKRMAEIEVWGGVLGSCGMMQTWAAAVLSCCSRHALPANACQLRPAPVQAEIAAIQKEKERIATTTIDDELAADPELAKVRGRGS